LLLNQLLLYIGRERSSTFVSPLVEACSLLELSSGVHGVSENNKDDELMLPAMEIKVSKIDEEDFKHCLQSQKRNWKQILPKASKPVSTFLEGSYL
jgi:hypothetical protein